MTTLAKIKKCFNTLSLLEKEELIGELYRFSKDTRLFLESKLGGDADAQQEFVRRMERETIKFLLFI